VGIVKVTDKNVNKIYKRSKQLQVLMNGSGFWQGRMPNIMELKDNIGYVADVTVTHSDKKWEKVLITELSNIASQWCADEEKYLEEAKEEEGSSKTINEENEEATKELDELTKEAPKEEKEKYPY
jgi:hypothetical protein|tara:strand:+ start:196 stop:570 length:375 start_codon:yes stop_codon:yes gene_type:complete